MKPLVETKARVGVFSIALGAYLPQFPTLLPEFEAQYEAFKKTLPDTVEIIDGGLVTTKELSQAAGDKFRAADVDLVIMQLLTYATSYNVYKDGEFVDNVNNNFVTITNLVNNVNYEFEVEAKNSNGVSNKTKITASASNTGEDYDPFIDDLNTPLEQLIGIKNMQTLFQRSNYSFGNNKRIKDALTSISEGNATNILYFGGSITVGGNATLYDEDGHQKGYAYYSYEWIKNNYDHHNVSNFINAGISGTGSEIGIIRANEDLYRHNPSIVFIEFAANNSDSDFYKQTFESLIRNTLNLTSNPGIIINISATNYTGGNVVKYIKDIASFYGLPICSLDDGLKNICEVNNYGQLKNEDPIFNEFIDDGAHPKDDGHKLYAKVIANFLRNLVNKETDNEFIYPYLNNVSLDEPIDEDNELYLIDILSDNNGEANLDSLIDDMIRDFKNTIICDKKLATKTRNNLLSEKSLTRTKHILTMLSQGYEGPEIGITLGISKQCVNQHLQRIRNVLKCGAYKDS